MLQTGVCTETYDGAKNKRAVHTYIGMHKSRPRLEKRKESYQLNPYIPACVLPQSSKFQDLLPKRKAILHQPPKVRKYEPRTFQTQMSTKDLSLSSWSLLYSRFLLRSFRLSPPLAMSLALPSNRGLAIVVCKAHVNGD